jgi:putative oxidoreductase
VAALWRKGPRHRGTGRAGNELWHRAQAGAGAILHANVWEFAMPTLFVIGRILFVLIFAVSGFNKLMDLEGTAQAVAGQVTVPQMFAGLAAQIESATGMATPKLLAIASGAIELGGALMIAFNIGTRFAAALLILFTAAATFYFHDFWNMAGAERMQNMISAQKNLTLIGGLLMLFALGSWRPYSVTRVAYTPPAARDERYPHPAE